MNSLFAGAMPAGNYQSDVVLLFTTAELRYFLEDSSQEPLHREVILGAQRLDQSFFAELATVAAHRLRDAVCVEQQRVAWGENNFGIGALPVVEHPQNGSVRIQRLEGTVLPEQKGRRMPAIDVV